MIGHKLNWEYRVSMVTSKASNCVTIMNRARHVLGNSSLFILYCKLYIPYMSNLCEVWNNTYKTTVHSVFVLQKKVIRLICNETFLCHTNSLFYELRISIIMFKAKSKKLPYNLQDVFASNHDIKHLTCQSNQNETSIYSHKMVV